MHCLSQHQFSHPQFVSSNSSSSSLQNNPSLPSLKHMGSLNSHSSSIPPQKNAKRSLNDFKQTKQLEDQKGLKKQKKDNVFWHLDSKESEAPVSVMSGVNGRDNLKDLQEKLHCKLKPELKKLCEVLKLPENVKGLADSYLEYVMNNHQVDRESKTSLQAFLISLCWIAASLLKHKLHHKESIALAKQHLKFRCRKEEAEYAYSLLRCLRRVFLCFNSPKAASASQYFTAYHLQLLQSNPKNACVTVEGLTTGQEISDDKVLFLLGLTWKDVSKSIADVRKKFDKKKKKLSKKQEEEMQKLNQRREAEMSRLEQWKKNEAAINHLVYRNGSIAAANKREWLDKEYDKKLGDLKFQMEKECKNLEEGHLVAQKKLQEREDLLVDGVKSWAQAELINKPVSRQIVDNRGNLKLSGVSNENQIAKKAKSISDRQGPDEIPTVPHSNEDENGTLPNPKESFTSDHQNVYNVNASSSEELNFDVPVTLEVTEAVFGSGDGLESILNKPSLRGQSLDEPTIVKHDVGSTGCLENPASSCSPSGEAIPSTHGKSSPPAENVETAAHDNVSIVVEPDDDTHDFGQYRANETVHKKSQSGEGLAEPTFCEVGESSKNGKHNGDVSADRTLDDQNFHSSDTSSKVNNQNREDSLDKHDTAAGRGEGRGNEVEQDVLNAPELVSASGKRAEDGSSGRERNVVSAVASHNFTGAAPLEAECESTTTRLLGVAPQSGNQNDSRQVEAANSHPQDDSDGVNGGTQTSFDGHVINNSHQSTAELVDNQVERSHQADAQHTTRSFQQAGEIPRPGFERHVLDTIATSIPPPMVNYLYQATPSVQMSPQSFQNPLENELERITKEKKQAILVHEQAKLRLNSEREKKIAEIHRKYDAKLQEIESEFLLKKKELDANYQIVDMNNILAITFRCKDPKYRTPPDTQPELSCSLPQHYMQQVTQLAAQNTAPRPPVFGRPPQLRLMSPGNLYIGSAYRAPMPHLLPPLRPLAQSAGVGISYYTCPMTGQQASNIPRATSPLFSQIPSPSRPSINPSGSQNRAHQPEAAEVLQSISSLSLLDEWLMDLDNQANRTGNPPSNCQRQMEVASNSDPLAPLQNIARGDPVSTGEVVHLSDDD